MGQKNLEVCLHHKDISLHILIVFKVSMDLLQSKPYSLGGFVGVSFFVFEIIVYMCSLVILTQIKWQKGVQAAVIQFYWSECLTDFIYHKRWDGKWNTIINIDIYPIYFGLCNSYCMLVYSVWVQKFWTRKIEYETHVHLT